jgi:hypothetical protein
MKHSEPEDLPEVHLRDVTEDETEVLAPPTPSRKKKWLMLGGLVVLLLVTSVGGYFLLRGNEVNVKAVRKTPERVTMAATCNKPRMIHYAARSTVRLRLQRHKARQPTLAPINRRPLQWQVSRSRPR